MILTSVSPEPAACSRLAVSLIGERARELDRLQGQGEGRGLGKTDPDRQPPLALAFLFSAGFLELSFSSMTQTLVQLNAPDASRGRVLGLYNMAAAGLRTFSGVTVGLAGSLVSIHVSLAVSAGLYAVTMGVLRLRSVTD